MFYTMSTSSSLEHQLKRVILRLRVNEFEDYVPSGYYDAIRTYLTFAGCPTSKLEDKKHYAHIEPFQDPELRQTSFHITLDIEKDMLGDPNFRDLPHEIYRIRRDEQGKL
jgi:hypothetical protein